MKAKIEWIEIKFREPTEEERQESEDIYGVNCDKVFDCLLPEDGEEVLLATSYGTTVIDTFYRDDGCYFENYDAEDIKAWAELPKFREEQK